MSVRWATTRSPILGQNYSTARSRPPRIGVIGSGPAGFYAARRLQQKVEGVKIDMYEMLPTPYGLVRFGVAPDHPEVKNCIDTFTQVAEHPSFTYIGNISIGTSPSSLPLSTLTANYDAILFAYGASRDKQLGIPGESLDGVHSARAFVGWYNGLPEYAGLKPDFERTDQAVVIGQGNVAMDVARILIAPLSHLRSTDITEEALELLSRSRIRNVKIVGRRGPLQAAYTTKELRELVKLENAHLKPINESVLPADYNDIKKLPRGALKRQIELLLKGSSTSAEIAARHWSLEYLLSPTRFQDNDTATTGRLARIQFQQNEYVPMTKDDVAKAAASAEDLSNLLKAMKVQPSPSSDPVSFEAGLAFRSVGYKSEPLDGLSDVGVPFDEKVGIIPNDLYGRVISPSKGPGELSAGHVPGMYAAGWVKRGPTGVIASTMEDAFISADVIRQDWIEGAKFLQSKDGQALGWEAVQEEAKSRGIRSISWQDWTRIDEAEKARGRARGKEREKFRGVDEMLKVLD
ncbi:NADPH:adrenodoxin oxidoreductase, mitochondrial [Sphaceloma murrayae]|uniref:NADPH:adrenodoxin oxidoreductase, mitochondrial n=1 Tax=Sphaceloma murrayae TaxID=2082308 RepID=A0A2K1R181_9PEZI|nr:NADPH:adrenodoxin oxidoreductase, mitochondrial [Sphaceloma murrayae]